MGRLIALHKRRVVGRAGGMVPTARRALFAEGWQRREPFHRAGGCPAQPGGRVQPGAYVEPACFRGAGISACAAGLGLLPGIGRAGRADRALYTVAWTGRAFPAWGGVPDRTYDGRSVRPGGVIALGADGVAAGPLHRVRDYL